MTRHWSRASASQSCLDVDVVRELQCSSSAVNNPQLTAHRPTCLYTLVCSLDCLIFVLGWLSAWRRLVVVSGVRRMNEVNARQARLVLRWVTVFGRVYHPGM